MVHQIIGVQLGRTIYPKCSFKRKSVILKRKISGIDVSREQLIFSRKENREEFYSVMEWQGKRLDFRTSLDDESFGRAIAVAGLYELEQLITEIHENNPMLGTIEASVVQKESRKTDESDENKVTNEKNNNKFAVELLIELEISGKRGLKATPFLENKRWTKNFSLLFSKINFRKKRIRWFFFNSFYRESVDAGFIFNKDDGFLCFPIGKRWKSLLPKSYLFGKILLI